MKTRRAFTLIEMLVTVAVIGILSAILLAALSKSKEEGKRTLCASNLKQVNLAIRFYADESADSLPVLPDPNPFPNGVGAYYKQLVKGYLALSGPAAPGERVFVCPSDTVECTNVAHAFTSYTFNGYEVDEGAIPRITGQKFSAIHDPGKAVNAGEFTAFWGGAFHPSMGPNHSDAKDILAFIDGHVNFAAIYWDKIGGSAPCTYEPPARYQYRWDGE